MSDDRKFVERPAEIAHEMSAREMREVDTEETMERQPEPLVFHEGHKYKQLKTITLEEVSKTGAGCTLFSTAIKIFIRSYDFDDSINFTQENMDKLTPEMVRYLEDEYFIEEVHEKQFKLGIYHPEGGNDPEATVYLALRPSSSGRIMLVAVNSEGRIMSFGRLLTFKEDRCIARHMSVNTKLGFNLDQDGRIEIKQ